MKNCKNYSAPAILEDVTLEMEGAILGQSVVNEDTEVVSTGQEIENHTMSEGYIHNWE
jgi:hypothetical protein